MCLSFQDSELGVLGLIVTILAIFVPLCCSCCHFWRDGKRKATTISQQAGSLHVYLSSEVAPCTQLFLLHITFYGMETITLMTCDSFNFLVLCTVTILSVLLQLGNTTAEIEHSQHQLNTDIHLYTCIAVGISSRKEKRVIKRQKRR